MQLYTIIIHICWLTFLSNAQLSDDEAADLRAYPPPVIFRNGPGQCQTNVVKCKEIAQVDFCSHLCIWTFQGYLMLNVSFSAWITKTWPPLSFELGPLLDTSEAHENPPDLNGEWIAKTGTNHILYTIKHVKFSDIPNAITITSLGDNNIYNGNIINWNVSEEKFVVRIFRQTETAFQDANEMVIGYLNVSGTAIEWSADNKQLSSLPIRGTTFHWNGEFPRERNCFNWGPLNKKVTATVESECGVKPSHCGWDGVNLNCSAAETRILEEQFATGIAPCPKCDLVDQWMGYRACEQRTKKMRTQINKCTQLAETVGGGVLEKALDSVCNSQLQMCWRFQSAKFTASRIELCPAPTIKVITSHDDASNSGQILPDSIPNGNPVVFACVDIPVTNGMISDMNDAQQRMFMAPNRAMKRSWYLHVWYWGKRVLFTLIGLKFLHFVFKKSRAAAETEEWDDAKFYEEYGDFYSDDDEEQDDYAEYEEIF